MNSDHSETILLTIFLKHDQSKNLDGIQGHLAATGGGSDFRRKGVEIVSWNVVMGIGQIVTLRLPPHLINAVNVEIERCAWGAFSTEFFPTYDFVPVRERLAREWREARNNRQALPASRADKMKTMTLQRNFEMKPALARPAHRTADQDLARAAFRRSPPWSR